MTTNYHGETISCPRCYSPAVKPVYVPHDRRNWYQCKGCGRDFVLPHELPASLTR